jgi:uncharacterized protein (DUF1800 family)
MADLPATPSLPPPATAFNPASVAKFDAAAARHLLRRLGYSATPKALEAAMRAGPDATVRAAFAKEIPMPKPDEISEYDEEQTDFKKKLRGLSEKERKELIDEARRRGRQAFTDYAVRWFAFAREPENSAQEKALAWLQDIVVVGAQKVQGPTILFDYQAMLRHALYGDYPTLLKSVMRHPAMIRFLDLNQSRAGAPNENFARELMELFSLGQNNYTEQDIKEAARALTGIHIRDGAYAYDARRHDNSDKTIFGKTGPWTPDDMIKLVTEHPAFPTFVAGDFLRYFVSWDGIPPGYAEELGKRWKAGGFKILDLPRIVFSSDLFYAPAVRGNRIKSPHEYYLGLCQDLAIDTVPYPGPIIGALRAMGQTFYDPPNVRGWIGGKNWINSSTLSARRQVARGLFQTINENQINADDRRALEAARKAGHGRFTVTDERLRWLAENRTNDEIARHLTDYFLPAPVSDAFRKSLSTAVPTDESQRLPGLKEAVVAILQCPSYQLG